MGVTKDIQPSKGNHPDDDIYDSLLRDLKSRDLASKEGRAEGRTVIFEPRPGDDSVVVGRREDLDRFHEFLGRRKARVQEVEVGRFPSAPEEVEKVRNMMIPRLSKARERLRLAKAPYPKRCTREASRSGRGQGYLTSA